jgi:PKD repeat protein
MTDAPTQPRARPIEIPIEQPSFSDDDGSRRGGPLAVFGAIGLAVMALAAVVILAAAAYTSHHHKATASGKNSAAGHVAPPAVPKLQFGFKPLSLDDRKLFFTQRWEVPASGTTLDVSIALQNLTGTSISYPLHVVVPKSVARTAADVDWGQAYTRVVHDDPVVEYSLVLAPHDTQTLDYSVRVANVTDALFRQWRHDELAAQAADFAESRTPVHTPKLALSVTSPTCTINPKQPCALDVQHNPTMQLVARVTADGKVVSGNTVVFTSSNSAIVRVDTNGVVTALAPGNAAVFATVGDPSDKLGVVVGILVTGTPTTGPPVASESCTTSQLTVQCDASASYSAQGLSLLHYDWDFGDGTHASGIAPSHTYASPGRYRVTLRVTDSSGATTIRTRTVTVTRQNIPPSAAFGCSANGLALLCDAGSSDDPDGSIAAYQWNLGDGSSGTGLDVLHNYRASGRYTVTLTVVDNLGATASVSHVVTVVKPHVNQPPTGDFSVSASGLHVVVTSAVSDPDGDPMLFGWSFGDGATASGPNAAHDYASSGTYTITLIVDDRHGGVVHFSHAVSVNVVPTGDFAATVDVMHVNVVASVSDPDGDTLSYAWDFGDGVTATGASAAHDYTTSGTYTITLVVDDGHGGVLHRDHMVTANAVPSGDFNANVNAMHVDVVASVSDPDGDPISFSWDFGDGATATGAAASHDYTTSGSYTITLVADDGHGGTVTLQHAVTVNAVPTGDFTVVATGLHVDLVATGLDTDGDTLVYTWDFGDGTAAAGAVTAHDYAAAGSYTITLTIDDGHGAVTTVQHSVSVS